MPRTSFPGRAPVGLAVAPGHPARHLRAAVAARAGGGEAEERPRIKPDAMLDIEIWPLEVFLAALWWDEFAS